MTYDDWKEAASDALDTLALILAEPFGCPWCDSGKRRSRKDHGNSCGFPRAHALVLKRINALMGAEAGTPEGEELNRLTNAVHAYEKYVEPFA